MKRHSGDRSSERSLIFCLLKSVLWICIGVAPSLAQESPCTPPKAVVYREWPEGGERIEKGRSLATTGHGRFGIDINSAVDIEIDATCLRSALADPAAESGRKVASLAERVNALTAAVENVTLAARLTDSAITAFRAADLSGDTAQLLTVQPLIGRQGTFVLTLLATLESAIVARRVESTGRSVLELRPEAKDTVQRVLLKSPYDWDLLRQLLAAELHAAHSAMDTMVAETPQIEVRAHLIGAGGAVVPLNLPGYNEALTGPENRVEKVQYAVSAEQARLFARYDSLIRAQSEARSVGAAVMESLRLQLGVVRADLEQAFGRALSAAESAERQLVNLKRWRNTDELTNWFEQIRPEIENTEAGRQWEAVRVVLVETQEDVTALRAYGELRATVASQTPVDATNTILRAIQALAVRNPTQAGQRALRAETWTRRVETVRSFAQAVGKLGPEARSSVRNGPVGDVTALVAAVEDVQMSLMGVAQRATDWVASLLLAPPAYLAATLPEPPGQKRVVIGGDIGTSFNLRTAPQARAENDRVRVSYRFLKAGQPVAGGWTDEFIVREFGWRARAIAGIAFTQRQRDDTWKPTAALSWTAKYRPWPGERKSGMKGIFGLDQVGVGFSAMTLNYDDSGQDVQLGLAPTISLLGDRLLSGYGRNLQSSTRRNFFFFSIRLFSATGALNP